MPTYDYQCPDCKEIHVIIHPMSEEMSRPCPKCDVLLVRKPSATSRPTFKGEGFYTTDKFN